MVGLPFDVIDLTHTLREDTCAWSGGCGFSHEVKLNYDDCDTEVKFRVQQIKMHAGIGTHIDAPAHCIPGGMTIEGFDLNDLIAPCFMIDVSHQSSPSFSVSADDILDFEKRFGAISPNSFVIVHTGWERYWHSADKYRNHYQFPSVSEEAARLLLQRKIGGLGIDTLSPDRPEDGFPVHKLLLGEGKYIIENVANSLKLPPTGSFSLALPIKAQGCTEAPIRLVALIPN